MIRLVLFVLCVTLCTVVSAGDPVQGPIQAPAKVGSCSVGGNCSSVRVRGRFRSGERVPLLRRGERRVALFGGC